MLEMKVQVLHRVRLLEGSWLVVRLKCTPDEKVTYVFVAFE